MKQTIKAVPTTSGNGFTKGTEYTFTHRKNKLYQTTNDNGHERFECYPFPEKSPHLWNGVTWALAGTFVEVN